MFTRRKRYNKKTTKKRMSRVSRISRKKPFRIGNVERKSKRVNKNKNKHKKIYRGGTSKWFTYDELPEDKKDDKCPICHDNFRETPGKVIYKTHCGHFFHNVCLNNYCNGIGISEPDRILNTIVCPICRTGLGSACIDVDAFQDKYLTANLSDKVREIYESER